MVQLENLVEDARGVMQSASENLPPLLLKDNGLQLDLQTCNEKVASFFHILSR